MLDLVLASIRDDFDHAKGCLDINEMESNTENLVMDFNDVNEKLINNNVTFTNEDIEIIENIVPYRKQGMFFYKEFLMNRQCNFNHVL